MLKNFAKICVFYCLIFVLTSLNAFSQISGGGSLETPISSQLGGLINSSVFKRLPSKSKPKTTSVKKPIKSTTVSKSTKSSKTTPRTPEKTMSVIPPNSSVLTFKPIGNLGIDRQLAQIFSQKTDEQEALVELFRVAKTAYESEAAKMGKRNDVAMAMTFFIASCLTVYHNTAEPSEAALDNLYNALAESMLEDEQFAQNSNSDKQAIHDRLVYISGLVLGGYTKGKQDNDVSTTQAFQLLAGACLKSLMQLDPDKLSFNQTGLVVKP